MPPKSIFDISENNFLDTLEQFQKELLPMKNMERKNEGLPPLTEQEEIDMFLDLRNEHRKNSATTHPED